MNLQNVRLSTLVVCGVLGYATCACSGSGPNAGSAAAAGVSGDDPEGGADDGGQSPGHALPGDATWFAHPSAKLDFDGLGGDCGCDAGKPRVAAPLPLPVPTPSPEMAR